MSRFDKSRLAEWSKNKSGRQFAPVTETRFQPPTEIQIQIMHELCEILDRHGGSSVEILALYPAREGMREQYSKTMRDIWKGLHAAGIKGVSSVYKNLCREIKTGKKIYYRTTTFGAHPVGYEFIGMVGKDLRAVYYEEAVGA